MAEVASTTPSVQVVGNAFVEQYYHVLHHSPDMVHKFYQDSSFISRPDEDGTMITVTTMKGINEKICSLDYTAYKAEIKTADAQESFKDGVVVLVTGSLTKKEDNQRKKFIQSFFLAPQDKGFFVLNDVFRYVDDSNPVEDNQVVVEEITTSLIPEPAKEEIQHVEEEFKEVLETEKPLTNENNSVGPEQNQTENNISLVVESVVPKDIENAPKMSYASILSSQTKKGGPGPTRVYVPASKKTENKSVNIVTQVPPTEVSPAHISINSPDSSNVHDDGDGHSVYIRNLPLNATVPQLETEFKKFGPIKQGGIQVRSNKHLGFCFGFVEFQDAISMQNAIQNSPVVIGGKETIVEIKRTTTRVGSGRGRGGFRNDGFRPRGGFSGGRGYSNGGRSDYGGGRGEFSGRGRGGRGGEPYHHQGGRRGGSIHYNSTSTTTTTG